MRILCTLENAGEEINGIKFKATEHGMLSESLPDDHEMAKILLTIPGYEPAEDVKSETKPKAEDKPKAEAKPKADAKAKADDGAEPNLLNQ